MPHTHPHTHTHLPPPHTQVREPIIIHHVTFDVGEIRKPALFQTKFHPGPFRVAITSGELTNNRKLRLHGRILVLLDADGFYRPLLAQIERAIRDGLEDPEARSFFAVTSDPRGAVELCEGSTGISRG